MAFIAAKGETIDVQVQLGASNTVAAGDCLMLDTTNKCVKPATSSTTTQTLMFVANQALTTSASAVNMNAVRILPDQLYIADCANATAANQLYIRQPLSTQALVNNTSSDTAGSTGVFLPIAIVGAVGGTQLLGYLISAGQIATT